MAGKYLFTVYTTDRYGDAFTPTSMSYTIKDFYDKIFNKMEDIEVSNPSSIEEIEIDSDRLIRTHRKNILKKFIVNITYSVLGIYVTRQCQIIFKSPLSVTTGCLKRF